MRWSKDCLNYENKDLNDLRKLICYIAAASMCLSLSGKRVLAQSENCSFLLSPQGFNTTEIDDRVVIGRVDNRPYIVLVTSDLQDNLPVIRACIPDAFLTSSSLGSYVHIASFDNYRDARDLADHMSESLDTNVRIIHQNRLGR